MSSGDPKLMTSEERQAEVSALLARGYLRLLVAGEDSQKALADPAESEPSCHPVNGSEDKLKEDR